VSASAGTGQRPARVSPAAPPRPPPKRTAYVYLFSPIANAGLTGRRLGSPRAIYKNACISAPFFGHLGLPRAPSTLARRFPLDICEGNAIACFPAFIQTRTRWCGRPCQTHLGMFVAHAAQQWERKCSQRYAGSQRSRQQLFFRGKTPTCSRRAGFLTTRTGYARRDGFSPVAPLTVRRRFALARAPLPPLSPRLNPRRPAR
jgi:hypothetical protein